MNSTLQESQASLPGGRSVPQVLISVLNWNNATLTIRCIESLLPFAAGASDAVELLVIDNGSLPADHAALRAQLQAIGVRLLRHDDNLGFAGGHNAALREALQRGIEFVWLVNNDAVVPPGTLDRLLAMARADPRCGAVAPCLAYEDSPDVYFAGAVHNWRSLGSDWCLDPTDDGFHREHADRIWLVGTALLLRTAALRQVGLFDESLFAYYEDDDIGERLRRAGWRSVVCRDVALLHNRKQDGQRRRPPYFYYLMARNHAAFFLRYTPSEQRRLLPLRLVGRVVSQAQNLKVLGHGELAKAALLGSHDGLVGRSGRPDLTRTLPAWFSVSAVLLAVANSVHAFFARRGSARAEVTSVGADNTGRVEL